MNSKNEILKHKYLEYLKHARGLADSSILKYENAIHNYELLYKTEDYGKFDKNKAINYREYLIREGLAATSIRTYLNHLKSYFTWLHQQPGFQRKISLNEVEYLNPSKKDNRLAAQPVLIKFPTHEQILNLINSFSEENEVCSRNKALLAFIYCTGMRDAAVRTLPLGSIDLEKMTVTQDPKMGVDVKFAKIIISKIISFDKELIDIILRWIKYLKSRQFGDRDPLFPKSKSNKSDEGFSYEISGEITKEFWSSSVSIRTIFKEAARRSKLNYFQPHTFRHASIYRALQCVNDALELKAVSQNFGHEDVSTTMSNYGNLSPNETMEIMDKINFNNSPQNQIPTDAGKKLEEIKRILF